ncbi:EAL domain-containing protein [Devosia sp. XJ19-1]|uniref:EAL domain-containing protein n=1 Tax=Devosia ureilytica TaxID=2952754 RepID=A0A9Q4FUL4_9HYPH|nr:EAL domain-containing protein [Devosia ureilytica]MCP8884835.1 EAL domain-containing protein [Devosia ureilytica]MCP8888654.1 EAL domain-containing protein [Devosia ureilytica]
MLAGDTELLLRVQTEVLEAVARGEQLGEVGAILCRRVESFVPGVTCSILLIDDNGKVRPLAGPSLPPQFSSAVDGLSIGPKAGSCGTAAWRKEPVIVTDIATDPLWEDYKGLALPLGLLASWSSPIRNADGQVIGTFAFYYGTKRGPTDLERQIVETCVQLCALAIEHERVQARNHHLAYFDVLTDLPNRAHFNAKLAERTLLGEPFGLILLDIDHLKLVNDSIGHAAGDALIRTIAARLSACRPEILPCRLGGDEIAMLVDGCADHAALEAVANRALAAVSGMVLVGDQSIDAHVTLGGALYGVDGRDADTISQNADFALYQAKQTHRGGYVGFRPGLRTAMVERISMVRRLDAAMAEGSVVPHYQPIVRLETAEIVGLEALARLVLPDGTVVPAGAFHAALDDPRIAYQLTGQMLDHVARDVRAWLDQGIPFQHVGVNVTTGDFQRGDLAERVGSLFAAHNVPLSHVVLEVNESVFMGGSDQAVPRAVECLRDQGILVALDDFGTGFASLTHLLSFPVDVIKIDRSFVEKLGSDQPSEVVVRALLDIASRLDMRVIAEGIETAQQAAVLRQFGCLMGQGYLFSRPVPADDVTQMLRLFGQKHPVPRHARAIA